MRALYSRKICVMLLILLLFLASAYPAAGASLEAHDRSSVLEKARSLQVPFIENRGQIDDESVKYYAKTFGGTAFITEDGRIIYSLPKTSKEKDLVIECRGEPCVRPTAESDQTKGWVIEEMFVDASITNVTGEDPAATTVSYFKGNDPAKWKTSLPTYNAVNFGEIYPGIELKLKAHGNNMEKLFHVKPGADPRIIKIRLAERPAAGGIGTTRPRQDRAPSPPGDVGARRAVPLPLEGKGGLSVNDNGELEIATDLGVVKFTKPLAYQEEEAERPAAGGIGATPSALSSGPRGGGRPESGPNMREYIEVSYAIEAEGYTFKVGEYDRAKELVIDPLLASTFLGGSSEEYPMSIALDWSGNVYVTGGTWAGDFPTTPGAYNTTSNGNVDVFVVKLNGDLTSLLASTFMGGGSLEWGYSIALDGSGDVYVTGRAVSTDFPTTAGAYDTTHNGGYTDVFVAKFNGDLTKLLASTFLGGGSYDYAYSIAVEERLVFVSGWTGSSDFPTTPGAYNTTSNGNFVAKLDRDLTSLLASTFIGGGGYNFGNSVALGGSENVFVTGYSGGDVLVARLSGDLTTLLASTFIGGAYTDSGNSIALDHISKNVYVTGSTNSGDFPTTAGAYDTSFNGHPYSAHNVFVAKLDWELRLSASTFIEGAYHSYGNSIAVDRSGTVYVTGCTDSAGFFTTPCTYSSSTSGVFVYKLSGDLTNLLASTFIGGSSHDVGYSIALDGSGNVYVAGSTGSSDFPTIPGAYDTTYNGNYDVFVAKLDSGLTNLPFYTLAVNASGSGTIAANPIGISCGADCTENYTSGTSVTLTATPASGWSFSSWSGCDSSSSATCSITMSSDKTVTATFTPLYILTVSKNGSGTITSTPSGISCGTDCTETYTSGIQVSLTATPDSGWNFIGWSDCDSTSGSSCYLSMDLIETPTATFAQPDPTITITSISPNLGTTGAGCPISVTGTGFQTASILFIGNIISEQISVSSDTLITAITPHGSAPIGSSPVPVSVVVVNQGKSSDPATDQVTFTYVHPGDTRDSQGFVGNQDGRVSVGEVQSVVNMFLTDLDVRPEADSNCDGKVKINEVQQAINSFLTLP